MAVLVNITSNGCSLHIRLCRRASYEKNARSCRYMLTLVLVVGWV